MRDNSKYTSNKFLRRKTHAEIGQNIRRIRNVMNYSQGQLAEYLGLHQAALSRIESGLQRLAPWQMDLLADLAGIKMDSLYSGKINYWHLAEKFGQTPPFPDRYRTAPYSRLRDILPLIAFTNLIMGDDYAKGLLSNMGIDGELLRSPDQPIGVQCKLDILQYLAEGNILNNDNLHLLIDQTRTEAVQGIFHDIYQSQVSVKALIKTYILNSHHYERDFISTVENSNSNRLEIAVLPSEHMKDFSYKDEVLGDILCQYKKAYISNLPLYIGNEPAKIIEKECHFHGAARCLYVVQVA